MSVLVHVQQLVVHNRYTTSREVLLWLTSTEFETCIITYCIFSVSQDSKLSRACSGLQSPIIFHRRIGT